jgi:hypothetical protein
MTKPHTSDYNGRMEEASARLGVTLKRHTQEKANGPCPWCGGQDRFVVWVHEGNYWCSHCKRSGYWDDSVDPSALAEAKAKKEDRRRTTRSAVSKSVEWIEYKQLVKEGGRARLWMDQGMTEGDIKKWGLGWCPSCPTAVGYESLTMPVFFQGVLCDIRHKLLGELTEETGRYRSHISGLMPFPYNMDALFQSQKLVVVEGEKKVIHLVRSGIVGTVGVPGATVTEDLLLHLRSLESTQTIILAFDPGASKQQEQLAEEILALGVRVYVADCFAKPDDLLLRYGKDVLEEVLQQSREWR